MKRHNITVDLLPNMGAPEYLEFLGVPYKLESVSPGPRDGPRKASYSHYASARTITLALSAYTIFPQTQFA